MLKSLIITTIITSMLASGCTQCPDVVYIAGENPTEKVIYEEEVITIIPVMETLDAKVKEKTTTENGIKVTFTGDDGNEYSLTSVDEESEFYKCEEGDKWFLEVCKEDKHIDEAEPYINRT